MSQRSIFQLPYGQKVGQGLVYLLCLGMIGVIWIALLVSLSDLATQVGSTESRISYILYSKGAGGLFGATVSNPIYSRFDMNNVLSVVMVAFIVLLVLIGLNTSLVMLYIYYFTFGIVSIMIDNGSTIGLVRLFGDDAGVWIGAGIDISFYLFASISALIYVYHTTIEEEFLLFTIFPFLSLMGLQYLTFGQSRETTAIASESTAAIMHDIGDKELQDANKIPTPSHESTPLISGGSNASSRSDAPSIPHEKTDHHYYSEIAISVALALIYGCISFFSTYVVSFTQKYDIMSTKQERYLIFTFFLLAFVSKIILVFDQIYFVDDQSLPTHLFITIALTCLATLIGFLDAQSNIALWIVACGLGFFGSNITPYLFDLLNRSTNASATSIAIAYVGIIIGESFIPPLFFLLFESIDWDGIFSLVIFLCCVLQIPLVWLAVRLSYIYNPVKK